MNDGLLPIAMSSSNTRVQADIIAEHLDGDVVEFFRTLNPYVNHLTHEAQEINMGLRPNPYAGIANDDEDVITMHVLAGVFLVGRAYEEVKLIDAATEGGLNHVCTVCGGDKSKLKQTRKKKD